MALADLLLDQVLHAHNRDALCCGCEKPHTYYVKVSEANVSVLVGLECIPDALGYKPSPGIYVNVPSRSDSSKGHCVWTGDAINPPHCDCEAFRRFNRANGQAECWHVVIVHDLGQTCPLSELQEALDAYTNRETAIGEHGGSRMDGPLVRRRNNIVQESEA